MQLPQFTTPPIPGAAAGLQALAGLVSEGAGKLDALKAGDGKALAALLGQIPGQDGEAPSGEQGQAFAEALAAILSMATAGTGAEVSPKADPAAAKTAGSSTVSPALLMQAIRDALGLDPQADATAPDAAQTAKAASATISTTASAVGAAAALRAPVPTGASAPVEHPDAPADTQPQPPPPVASAPGATAAAPPPTTTAIPDSAPQTTTAPAVSAAATADADLAAEARPGEKPQTRGDIRRTQKASADPAVAAPQAGSDGRSTRAVAPVEGKPDADAAGLQPAAAGPDPSAEAETDAPGDAPTPPLAPAVNASAQPPAMPKAEPATFVHLASQIVQKLNAKVTRFDLELLPAGLGKVDVKIEITPSGQLTAALSCDNPHAAAELKGRAEELRSALQQAGFTLSDSGLSFDFNGQQQRWAQDRRDDARAFAGKAFAAAVDKADDLLASVAEAAARLDRRAALGGLDLRI